MRILVYSERARRAKRHRGALGLIDRDDRAPARPRPPTRRLAAAGVVMLAHAGASALPGCHLSAAWRSPGRRRARFRKPLFRGLLAERRERPLAPAIRHRRRRAPGQPRVMAPPCEPCRPRRGRAISGCARRRQSAPPTSELSHACLTAQIDSLRNRARPLTVKNEVN